jgi:PAS domain S-box-containing protein
MTGESVLVVEDESLIALQLRELLEKNGYRVTGATAYGEDAVAIAGKESPDLIFMDIGLMGTIDGIEAARQIHEKADIPIIYLTSHSDNAHLDRAKETTPYSYLVKPFSDRELLVSAGMALHRHAIDRQLRESMERYRAIVDNAAESILLVSLPATRIVEANPAFTRLTGYDPGELTGREIGDLITIPAGGTGTITDRLRSPDGWSSEVGFRCRDGTMRDAELTSRVIHSNGAAAFSCIIAHDITDRKRADRALREAHRKLNLLSGITRHDILNQLALLYGFLELSRPEVAGTPLEKYVEKEIMAAEAIRRMISFTKDYEEIGQQQPGWHRPDGIIRQLARTASPPGMVIDSRLGELELYADPLLERVFHNLLDNAVRHGDHVKKITVSAIPAGTGLVIRWEDDGAGVPEWEKAQIFERGFGKNTGLGLFLVREILGLTGITIRETGTYGTGARFEMTVPAGAFRYHG